MRCGDFQGRFRAGVSMYIPNRLAACRRKTPWLTRKVLRLMKKRDATHRQAKCIASPAAWSSYRRARNQVVSALRLSKEAFLSSFASKTTHLKEFCNSIAKVHQRVPSVLTDSDSTTSASSMTGKANLLNTYFQSCFTVSVTLPASSPSECCSVKISDVECTSSDVMLLLQKMRQQGQIASPAKC